MVWPDVLHPDGVIRLVAAAVESNIITDKISWGRFSIESAHVESWSRNV